MAGTAAKDPPPTSAPMGTRSRFTGPASDCAAAVSSPLEKSSFRLKTTAGNLWRRGDLSAQAGSSAVPYSFQFSHDRNAFSLFLPAALR